MFLVWIVLILTSAMPTVFSTLRNDAKFFGLPPVVMSLLIQSHKKRARDIQEGIDTEPAIKVPKSANRHRNRGFMLLEMDFKSDCDFKAMFRMSRGGFDKLLGIISTKMNHSDSPISLMRATSSSGSPISKKAKLGATLRWLAGGSYHDICTEFGISPNSFFNEESPYGTSFVQSMILLLYFFLPMTQQN